MRPRTVIGYVSASIEPCTLRLLDFATPTPNCVQNSMNAFTARPVRNAMSENASVAQPMIGPRRKRSASHPIGSAPSTMNEPAAALMKTIAPLLMPKESRMSGASTPSAALDSSSSATIASNTANTRTPPRCNPCRSVIASSPTPGSSASAKTTCSLLFACAA